MDAAGGSSSSRQRKKTCYRCGSDGHLANAPKCPAVSVTCRRCHKVGHFANVCRAAQTSSREVCEVEPNEEVNILEVTVLSTDCSALANDKNTCTVEIRPERSRACRVTISC